MDPDSGKVTVSNSELLDREKQAVYYLTLQATDGGNLSSSTTLQIHVLDVNDNSPMVSGSYNIFVQEEEGNVSVTIQVRASLKLVGGGNRPRAPSLALWSCWPCAGIWALLCGPEKVTQSLWASISSLENKVNHRTYSQGHKGYKVLPSTERALKNHTAL